MLVQGTKASKLKTESKFSGSCHLEWDDNNSTFEFWKAIYKFDDIPKQIVEFSITGF